MRRTFTGAVTALALALLGSNASGNASGQEALPREYGYKLADRTSDASYLVSGIRRGSEPESIEAWIWTVTPSPAGADGDQYDAKAQWSVLRCTGKSIELIRTEFYLGGAFVKSVEAPPRTLAEVKPGTPMAPIWRIACDSAFRFNALTVFSLEEAYALTGGTVGE